MFWMKPTTCSLWHRDKNTPVSRPSKSNLRDRNTDCSPESCSQQWLSQPPLAGCWLLSHFAEASTSTDPRWGFGSRLAGPPTGGGRHFSGAGALLSSRTRPLGSGDEGCIGKPGDLEWNGAAPVAMRVCRRVHGRHGHRVRLLQLHCLLVTPLPSSIPLLPSAQLHLVCCIGFMDG